MVTARGAPASCADGYGVEEGGGRAGELQRREGKLPRGFAWAEEAWRWLAMCRVGQRQKRRLRRHFTCTGEGEMGWDRREDGLGIGRNRAWAAENEWARLVLARELLTDLPAWSCNAEGAAARARARNRAAGIRRAKQGG